MKRKEFNSTTHFYSLPQGERREIKRNLFNQKHFVCFCEFWRSQSIEIDTTW
jgi:hypothetical protein